ncbi:hypothetical protein CCHR01_12327 [Colletotrichum chrysophilum]|uniref:Uncharacterized protein n=1 Tax=Colletotrichum chrysophilum TaxID=1836956 RepID=A0AAD9ACV3_9PEZI|nr:hypothetical protein CCHR01_12327 [Colletotrichum chrysophilum]
MSGSFSTACSSLKLPRRFVSSSTSLHWQAPHWLLVTRPVLGSGSLSLRSIDIRSRVVSGAPVPSLPFTIVRGGGRVTATTTKGDNDNGHTLRTRLPGPLEAFHRASTAFCFLPRAPFCSLGSRRWARSTLNSELYRPVGMPADNLLSLDVGHDATYRRD